jgi:hypothetical protein
VRKQQKFHPRQLVKVTQACSIDVDGVEYTFSHKSDPVRAEHPAVKSNPDLFEPVDPDASEPPPA